MSLNFSYWFSLCATILVSIILAEISYRFIELPSIALGKKYAPRITQ